MSTTVGAHSGAGPLSLMSCVRESSPLQDYEPADIEKNVVSKRKFWNPKKWFRKKQKTGEDITVHPHHHHHHHHHHNQEAARDADGSRSRSFGELSTDEEPSSRSHEVRNSTSMHPGLSVSHDSVFHPLTSGSSDLELDGAQSSSSLSMSQPLGDAKLQTELSSRLRLRRGRGDTSEDDEGLPRSPLCGSPAAATDSFLILEKTVHNKDLPTKSHSTCSDGSLLSMDSSSEMDEDSLGLHSRHSSRVSLNEKESDLELLGPSFSTTPLNHSAAHHRVSVRPKRTYGAPRRKKGQLSSALPATPEVNEDSSIRSISPESVVITEPITAAELYSSRNAARSLPISHQSSALVVSSGHDDEVKFKCNSLPAGATPPTSDSLFRLSRSKSNAGKSQDDVGLHGAGGEEKLSLFERLFPRRSGRKKRKDELRDKEAQVIREVKVEETVDSGGKVVRRSVNEEKKTLHIHSTTTPTSTKLHTETRTVMASHHSHAHHTKKEESKPAVAPRTGAAARQRIQPIDIPVTPKQETRTVPISSPISPERSFSPGTSPIQMELEHYLLRHRQIMSPSPSPAVLINTPPQSPKSPKLSLLLSNMSSKEFSSSHSTTTTRTSSNYSSASESTSTKPEDNNSRSKIKIAGLSALQQRVLSLNSSGNSASDESDSFKSLTDFATKVSSSSRPVAKSHSFKANKEEDTEDDVTERRKSVTKASSLDSVKNLEEPVLKSELKLTLKPTTIMARRDVMEREADEIEEKKSQPEVISHTYKQQISDASEQKEPPVEQQAVVEERTSVKASTESAVPKSFSANSITISGPSHTAIVNVSSKSGEEFSKSCSTSENETTVDKKVIVKENHQQVSVTKIQLKHDTTTSVMTKTSVVTKPEFLNKQLNKVEARPSSNIVFSMKSPKIVAEENSRPKTLFNFPASEINGGNNKALLPRKFSKEDVEIIEKTTEAMTTTTKEDNNVSPPKTPTTPTQSIRFKKNDSNKHQPSPSSRKSSVISVVAPDSPKESVRDRRALKTRSISLDSLKGGEEEKSLLMETATQDKSSQDSLVDKRSSTEGVVLRRKSFAKQKTDEEPELMKVFARRSLKLKDGDVEQLQEAIADEQRQRDSDKENNTETTTTPTPESENKTISLKETKPTLIENVVIVTREEPTPTKPQKQPLAEIKKSPEFAKNAKEEPEVQLRRSINNNIFLATQRAASLNAPKAVISDFHIKKQASLNERRTHQWISAKKEDSIEEHHQQQIITSNVTTKSEEVRTETKNFSQRRAEWEKRVQQAQK